MEEQCRHRHCAAGLGNQPRCSDDGTHCGTNLRFSDGDDVIDEGLDIGEVAFADALRAQAVGDGAAGQLAPPGDDLAGAEAFRRVAGQLRLDAKDLAWGRNCLTAAATPLSRPPPLDRRKHQIHVGQGFDDLQAAGGLAGDDLLVVIWRNDHVAVLAHQFLGHGQPLAGGHAHIHNSLRPAPVWRLA